MNIMNIMKSSIVLIFTAFISTGIADVEDIIESQKDIQQSERETLNAENILLNNNKNAIEQGKYEFELNCAICHGVNGKGKGIFSSQLVYKPSDLTQIKKRNSGTFPAIEIYEVIDGRIELNVHGTRDMPIWGSRYEAESWLDVSPKFAETITRGKILELILYLNTIQE